MVQWVNMIWIKQMHGGFDSGRLKIKSPIVAKSKWIWVITDYWKNEKTLIATWPLLWVVMQGCQVVIF